MPRYEDIDWTDIKDFERAKAIKDLEAESAKKKCTQIFIETPYRNNQLTETILKNCKASTQLCIAVDITAPNESIKTKTIAEWQKNKIDIPTGICKGLSDDDFDKMINVSLGMKPLWENALGKDWEKIMTREKLRALYERL